MMDREVHGSPRHVTTVAPWLPSSTLPITSGVSGSERPDSNPRWMDGSALTQRCFAANIHYRQEVEEELSHA
jgi:hypothetical protein